MKSLGRILFIIASIIPYTIYSISRCNRTELSSKELYPQAKEENSVRLISYNIRSECTSDQDNGNS